MKLTKKNAAIGMLCSFAFAGAVQAQVYTEVSYSNLTSRGTVSSGNTESNGQSVAGIVGYGLNSNYSVEGLLGTGLGGADVKLNGASQAHPVTSRLDQVVGVYVRGKKDLNEDASVFVRLGWNEWRTTASNNLGSASSTLSDWAYGVGLNYRINQSMYVTGSWMNVYNKDSVKADGWSVGLGYRY